jgi:hypothetical protein
MANILSVKLRKFDYTLGRTSSVSKRRIFCMLVSNCSDSHTLKSMNTKETSPPSTLRVQLSYSVIRAGPEPVHAVQPHWAPDR